MTTTTPGALSPLWSDANIVNDAKRASSNPSIQATVRSCLLFMRHGYEAERQLDKARIADLEQQLAASCNSSRIDFANAAAAYDELQEAQRDLEAARSASAGQWEPVMRYSHRDGEYELPTEPGWYWVNGIVKVMGEPIHIHDCIIILPWHDGTMLTRIGDETFLTLHGRAVVYLPGEWDCRWWGPVVAPWERVPAGEAGE